jgi:hypothetical protein
MEHRSYRFSMKGLGRKYLLLPGSELLRSGYWVRATKNELKGLIKRFATRENQCRRKGNCAYRWRSYRLRAVGVYERRFERVPDIFRGWKLPPMKSYYVRDGRYVWPEHGDPGRLVFPRSQ